MCDLAGVSLPAGSAGRSLRPLLDGADTGGDPEWRDHLVAETRFRRAACDGRMVRTERFKYVVYSWGAFREQLFDLHSDPGEMVNLAVSSRHSDVLQKHRDLLRAWCARTGDGFSGGHYSHPSTPHMVPGDEYPRQDLSDNGNKSGYTHQRREETDP